MREKRGSYFAEIVEKWNLIDCFFNNTTNKWPVLAKYPHKKVYCSKNLRFICDYSAAVVITMIKRAMNTGTLFLKWTYNLLKNCRIYCALMTAFPSENSYHEKETKSTSTRLACCVNCLPSSFVIQFIEREESIQCRKSAKVMLWHRMKAVS